MNFLEFLDRTIIDPSPRRLVIVLSTLLICILLAISYEITTASLTIEKHSKSINILKDLDTLISSKNKEISETSKVILSNIQKDLITKPQENSDNSRLVLPLIMAIPWLIAAIFSIIEARKKQPDWEYGLLGCVVLTAIFGGTSYFVPTDLHWFFRYICIPLFTFTIVGITFYKLGNDKQNHES